MSKRPTQAAIAKTLPRQRLQKLISMEHFLPRTVGRIKLQLAAFILGLAPSLHREKLRQSLMSKRQQPRRHHLASLLGDFAGKNPIFRLLHRLPSSLDPLNALVHRKPHLLAPRAVEPAHEAA